MRKYLHQNLLILLNLINLQLAIATLLTRMNNPITSIAYLNQNTFVTCLNGNKIQAWSITPTQKIAENNNVSCFQVSRIDDQKFLCGSSSALAIYSIQSNQINKISASLSFNGLNFFQVLNSQYAVANSNIEQRIYDLNQQTYESFFYLIGINNPNKGLFFNPNDDIMMSPTSGQITIWDKKQKTMILGQFNGVTWFQNSDAIQMIQAQIPLSERIFLAQSANQIYRQQYKDNKINQLSAFILNSKPLIKFRVVGQKVVIIDQNSLQILSSNLDQDQSINQSFSGFDSLRYQENLILYDSQNNVYLIQPTHSLMWCNSLCSTCQESDANICLSCKQANMIVNSNSQCVCKDGFYMDSNQICQQCSPSCKTCSDQNKCLTCDFTQFRVFNNNTKQCDCKQSYYSLSSQPKCVKCPYYCQTCELDNQLNSIRCLQCFQNPTLNRSNTGNCQCLPGYFDDGTNVQCVQCNYTCYECDNTIQCSSCDSSKNRNFNSFSSTCTCQSGYYDDGVNQSCQICPYNCKECQKQGAKIVCTDCNTIGTFRQNDQICSCQDGYYDAGQLKCTQCNSGCQSCDSKGQCHANCPQNCIFCNSQMTCTKCKPLTYLVNQQCQNSCNSNQYADDTQQICVNCPSFCIKCNLDPTKCQQCISDYVLYQNNCLIQCPDGSYKDSNYICQPCPQNCLQCDSNDTCKKCQDGFYLYQKNQCLANCPDGNYNDSNNICQLCQQNCIKCNSSGICSLCQDGFYLYKNQQCLKNCPNNYYPDSQSKACQICMQNCELCSSSNQCNQCVQTFYLLNDSQCLSDCPQNYFKDTQKNICTSCFLNCNQCNDSHSCKVCSSGFYLLNGLSCVQNCPDEYFENLSQGICQLCSTNFCQKCNQQNKCLQCKNNYFLKDTECVLNCGQGFQIQNNICIACKAKNCLGCDKQIDQCSSCLNGFELFKNDCYAKCLPNQLRDEKGSCFEQNQFMLEYKSNNQIQMVFKYKPNFEDIKKELQLQIPALQGQFDYKIDIQDNFTLLITISTTKKLDNKQTVTISINDNTNQFINPQQSIDIQIIQKKQDESPAASKSFETATQAVSTATIAAIFPLALSGNFWMISSILDISQIIYMTSFIQFQMSSTLDTFLSSQKNFKIPFPNFFEYINHYEEIVYDTPPQISEKDIQGFYLSNMGDTLSLLAIIILAYAILKLLVYAFAKCKKVQNLLIKIEKKLFPVTLIADLLWVVYQDMSFSVILQLITLNVAKYAVEILNYFIFSVSFFGIILPVYLTFIIYSGSNKEIKEHLTKDQQFNYYQILLYFRKFFYTVVIGALQTSPITQILLITIFHLILLLITIKLKPFKANFVNIKEGIQSSSFLICHILVLVLYQLDNSDSLTSKTICWVILSIFSLIIIFEVIICFREIYIAIKEVYAKYKKNRNKKLTIVPYNEKDLNQKQEKQIDDGKDSVQNRESQNYNQDQNIGLDLSPTKLDSRQFISTIYDQNQTNTPNSPIKRRKLRSGRILREIEAKTQVPDNQNIGTMLKIYKSGSDLSEGQTFRDFRAVQSQRSTFFLLEDQNSKSNNNSIIQTKKEFQESNKNKSCLSGE
ncbi:surface protein with EGF domain and furin-like repeat protein, putative (macronuclear) [Tetrahymena thermophila SB210]|uniref:Surface protein with EGF domain and furin-like repeat protein, putative n=1 Tax=Tetrahymena thermophila (strain SB210) TaxID=312017 RepID=I7MKD4_TETTS|nr:surface protein with EGF domain and furin-like repeat protein, putative [Tetrahymena thermophila SB210]EAR98213.2 surface protein with EGF domain and furin-like repeat protein, putative [Tetrahymena thermophila SB210]|eukprot:XP_001018458.2 surface protein with EGF domain and furin-like repeat protein, putative [Tetrahymena thermophila SB210]